MIRFARLAQGLRQGDLGRATGYSASTISRLENCCARRTTCPCCGVSLKPRRYLLTFSVLLSGFPARRRLPWRQAYPRRIQCDVVRLWLLQGSPSRHTCWPHSTTLWPCCHPAGGADGR
ncbi:helix-turn-helix domain-containing protein [Streptosporangium lutulentum]